MWVQVVVARGGHLMRIGAEGKNVKRPLILAIAVLTLLATLFSPAQWGHAEVHSGAIPKPAVAPDPAASDKLIISQQPPGTVAPGQSFLVEVQRLDVPAGNLVTNFDGVGAQVRLTIVQGPSGTIGTVLATRQATNGVITFGGLSLTIPGTYNLQATVASGVSAAPITTNPINVVAPTDTPQPSATPVPTGTPVPPKPATLVFINAPGTTEAGDPLNPNPRVGVVGDDGKPNSACSGETVRLTINPVPLNGVLKTYNTPNNVSALPIEAKIFGSTADFPGPYRILDPGTYTFTATIIDPIGDCANVKSATTSFTITLTPFKLFWSHPPAPLLAPDRNIPGDTFFPGETNDPNFSHQQAGRQFFAVPYIYTSGSSSNPPQPIEVQVLNRNNIFVPTANNQIEVQAVKGFNNITNFIRGTTVKTASGGVARFDDLRLTKATLGVQLIACSPICTASSLLIDKTDPFDIYPPTTCQYYSSGVTNGKPFSSYCGFLPDTAPTRYAHDNETAVLTIYPNGNPQSTSPNLPAVRFLDIWSNWDAVTGYYTQTTQTFKTGILTNLGGGNYTFTGGSYNQCIVSPSNSNNCQTVYRPFSIAFTVVGVVGVPGSTVSVINEAAGSGSTPCTGSTGTYTYCKTFSNFKLVSIKP